MYMYNYRVAEGYIQLLFQVFEITQKSEKLIGQLKEKIAKLEQLVF